ncbi:hypothetical protein ACEPAF_7677 [Sanghuangporus sanghuang]
MPLPSNSSISLQGHSRPGEGVTTMPKIAMIVRMTEETLDALQSLSGADRMDFEFGDKPGIYVRGQFFPMRYDREKENQELFIRTTMPNRPNAALRLNANVVGKFTVEKVLSDRLSQRLHHATAAAVRQRAERKAIMVNTPLAVTPPVAQKPAPKRKAPPKSTPKSIPTIVKSYATTSPNPTASPNGSVSIALPKELATTYRQRLIHYLALGSATVQDIFKEFGGSEIDHNTRAGILDLLHDVAEREEVSRKAASTTQLANWRLKPQTWLEVRPYQYSGYTDNVRTRVARTARTWFGSLKIPEDDPAWDHVKFRDSGHGNAGSNAQSGQRAMNGTTSAAAKAKKGKATTADAKVKSEVAAPLPRPSQASSSLPPKPSGVSMRAGTPMRSTKGKEREGETEKEEGELSASQTPPRMPAVPAERRQPISRPNGASTPTMPPPPVPVSFQSQQLSSSVAAKRPGPVDARGPRRPPPDTNERSRAAPPLPSSVDRKPITQIKKEVVAQTKKERASVSLSENGVTTSSASSQSAKERDRELARRERGRDKESDKESIRAARKERERESDRESIRGRNKERALKDIARDRDQERPREKLKEKSSASSRPVAKTSTKRKPPSESSDEESSDWGYEDRRRSSAKLKRDRESITTKSTSSLKAPVTLKQKTRRETSPLLSTKVKSIPVERKVVSASSSKASLAATRKEPKVDGVSRSTSVKLHKRRRSSIDFTSSSEEEEERKPRNSVSTTKGTGVSLSSKASAAANITRTIPPKPRPALSKREQLRSRYQNIYGEYIMVFQKLVAHKNRVQAVLRHGSESPSGESDIDMNDMIPLDEVQELTARHQRLHNELEEIKKSYMT